MAGKKISAKDIKSILKCGWPEFCKKIMSLKESELRALLRKEITGGKNRSTYVARVQARLARLVSDKEHKK